MPDALSRYFLRPYSVAMSVKSRMVFCPSYCMSIMRIFRRVGDQWTFCEGGSRLILSELVRCRV